MLGIKPTRMVSRKLRMSRAVQMLLKLGWWFSTVVSSLSNHANFSSVFGQKSGRSAIFRRATHRRDNISPGEPGLSFTFNQKLIYANEIIHILYINYPWHT